MKWKVENALSRDVERQQLNKILAEIKAAINTASTQTQQPVTNTVNTVTRYAVARFTFTLEGDVTGSAVVDGTDNVTLTTTLADDVGVEEAPINNQYYMRWNGEWKPAPAGSVPASGFGILVQTEGDDFDAVNVTREIEVVPTELTIADGDGQAGNPTLGLADTAVTPGSYTNANIDVDQFGRVTFAEDGTGGSGGGGILPLVTGDVPPEFVYLEDGSLVYVEIV